jgi:hypothetical protein
MAVAHQLVYAIYNVLSRREEYRAVSQAGMNEVQRQRVIRHHPRRLRRLGVWVEPEKLTPLKEWYATHRIPEIDAPTKRLGRPKKAEVAANEAQSA